jgi:PAS domain S-box-containing protein
LISTSDEYKTREQLLEEIVELRQQVSVNTYLLGAIEATPVGVVITDSNLIDNPIIYSNPAFTLSTGYQPSEITGKNCRFLQGKDTKPLTISAIRDSVRQSSPFCGEILNYKKDGTAYWNLLKLDPIFDENGKCAYYVGIQEDVSESKDKDEKLKDSLEQLQLSTDTAKLGMWQLEIATGRLEWNDQQLVIYGLTRAQYEEDIEAWQSQIHPEDVAHTNNKMEELSRGIKVFDLEFRIIRADGQTRTINGSGSPIYSDKGELVKLMGINVDITERRKLEVQLRQSSKMHALGTLAGGIAHDFNNIMAIILGNTELCLMRMSPDSEGREQLEKVTQAGERATELVRQIMTFGRMNPVNFIPLNLADSVKEFLKMIRATVATNVKISADLIEPCPIIRAEETRIHQILLNLCNNAVQAMGSKSGEIVIGLEVVEHVFTDPDTMVEASCEAICLSIQDSGQGIEAKTLERIFDPFFTTKKVGEGTGLGLSVVHSIVMQQQGHISIESTRGLGTKVSVLFPVIDDLVVEQLTVPQLQVRQHRGNILIVEDEQALGSMHQLFLETQGYSVTLCSDGAEALLVFAENINKFDLVLTDYAMPEISGLELASKLLAMRPELPIILSSGNSNQFSEAKASEIGVRCCLDKPVSLLQIQETIDSLLA